ncbi:hypothetical protein [Lactovum odontotermitis]
MKKSFLYGAAALGALTLAAVSAPTSASADTQIPLYRTYNPNSGEHFYTTSYDEALNAYNAGWNIEGVGWQTPSSGSAVYRVFNPNSRNAGSHYYTANKSEADHLVSLGWKWDNNGLPVFYSGGQFSVYVQYNRNNSGHNYTTSLNEQKSVVAAGWAENSVTIHAVGEGNQNGAKNHNSTNAPAAPAGNAPSTPANTGMTQVEFQRLVANNLQDMIMNQYLTAYPTDSFIKDTSASRISKASSDLQKYILSPNTTGDYDDGGMYSNRQEFFQSVAFSGEYTSENASKAAQSLYNAYNNESAGYTLMKNNGIDPFRYRSSAALTANGVTYSFSGTVGTNPSRIGYIAEFSNFTGSGNSGRKTIVAVGISNGKIHSIYAAVN